MGVFGTSGLDIPNVGFDPGSMGQGVLCSTYSSPYSEWGNESGCWATEAIWTETRSIMQSHCP